jgi:hypothetical protein
MKKKITISTKEELEMRRSFELGAYLLITHCLAKTYGTDELGRFARFWAETAASVTSPFALLSGSPLYKQLLL